MARTAKNSQQKIPTATVLRGTLFAQWLVDHGITKKVKTSNTHSTYTSNFGACVKELLKLGVSLDSDLNTYLNSTNQARDFLVLTRNLKIYKSLIDASITPQQRTAFSKFLDFLIYYHLNNGNLAAASTQSSSARQIKVITIDDFRRNYLNRYDKDNRTPSNSDVYWLMSWMSERFKTKKYKHADKYKALREQVFNNTVVLTEDGSLRLSQVSKFLIVPDVTGLKADVYVVHSGLCYVMRMYTMNETRNVEPMVVKYDFNNQSATEIQYISRDHCPPISALLSTLDLPALKMLTDLYKDAKVKKLKLKPADVLAKISIDALFNDVKKVEDGLTYTLMHVGVNSGKGNLRGDNSRYVKLNKETKKVTPTTTPSPSSPPLSSSSPSTPQSQQMGFVNVDKGDIKTDN